MKEIVKDILNSIDEKGYYYTSLFGSLDISLHERQIMLIKLASHFGKVRNESANQLLVTNPSTHALPCQAFNQGESIGWHNDFSTYKQRPSLSFSWIAQADPQSPHKGNWRLANVREILRLLWKQELGSQMKRRMTLPIFPFGYDNGDPIYFPMLQNGRLRFYHRAMKEGLKKGIFKEKDISWYCEIIKCIQDLADQVGEECEASTGALMVSHNGYALHDRLEQTVVSSENYRKAILCFVD